LLFAVAALSPVFRQNIAPPQAQSNTVPQAPLGTSSLGRIQPDETITIGGRSLSGQPSIVAELHVKDGDYIKAGQTIAVLDSLPQLEAARRQAESRVRVAEARLKQVMAGPKAADIAAQQAVIAQLEVELANATTRYARTESLYKSGVATQPALDQDRLPVDLIPHRIAEAKERLRSLEIRQADIDVEAAALEAAKADVQRAMVESEAAVIRSPYNGMVMKVYAWRGGEIGPRGILELARVDRMYVIAEVAESDIQRVKVGQRAKITGYSLPKPIEGQVERLGLKVSRNSLVQDNPVNLTDARIVEVKIRLDDGSLVRNLIDAQVDVLIQP